MPDGLPWSTLFTARLAAADAPMAGLIRAEEARNGATVNLIASESYCPRATLEAEASILTVKNATGYPQDRCVAGCEVVNEIERLAQSRACALFGAETANVQPLSSTIGNIAVLRGLLGRGETLLCLAEEAGGHHSHGAPYHLSGRDYVAHAFGADEARGGIDLDRVRALARQMRPRAIVAGSTAYPRAIDFRGLRAVADEVGALLVSDIAHVAGLVAAGLHDNPVSYSDAATTSTHKTLCGPRTGGVILAKAGHAPAIDAELFPGMQGAPGAHIIAARAVLFDLVARAPFRALMQRVVANAAALADGLREAGVPLWLGGTDTHMVVADLRAADIAGRDAERRLEAHGVLSNGLTLPPRAGLPGRGGLRLGSTAMTIRGLDAAGFSELGRLIAAALAADGRDGTVARRIADLAASCPVPATALQ